MRWTSRFWTAPHPPHRGAHLRCMVPAEEEISDRGDGRSLYEQLPRDGRRLFSESSDLAVAQVTVNYLHGFGWLTQMCRDVSFTGVHFHPDSQHHVSSFADCIHVCGCKGTVTIKDCSFTQAHDDAINIHGAFLRFVRRVDDHTAVFQFVHRQQGGYRAFFPGDTVRFIIAALCSPVEKKIPWLRRRTI